MVSLKGFTYADRPSPPFTKPKQKINKRGIFFYFREFGKGIFIISRTIRPPLRTSQQELLWIQGSNGSHTFHLLHHFWQAISQAKTMVSLGKGKPNPRTETAPASYNQSIKPKTKGHQNRHPIPFAQFLGPFNWYCKLMQVGALENSGFDSRSLATITSNTTLFLVSTPLNQAIPIYLNVIGWDCTRIDQGVLRELTGYGRWILVWWCYMVTTSVIFLFSCVSAREREILIASKHGARGGMSIGTANPL